MWVPGCTRFTLFIPQRRAIPLKCFTGGVYRFACDYTILFRDVHLRYDLKRFTVFENMRDLKYVDKRFDVKC